MTTKTDALLWIDTETTAIEPRDGQLLEVGMILTDMQGAQLEGLRTWKIRHDCIRMTPTTVYAIDLHSRNGLIDRTFEDGIREDQAARLITETLTRLADAYRLHPAGTNVDFGLKWLSKALGIQAALFDHHKLDLSSLRILMKQVCLGAYQHEPTDHRVATCITRDIREYGRILAKITALAEGAGGHEAGDAL